MYDNDRAKRQRIDRPAAGGSSCCYLITVANPAQRLADNVEGDFYVDDSCIDCGACRWIAPASFSHGEGGSRVHRQPETPPNTRRALLALVACPTASIGSQGAHDVRAAAKAYPDPISDRVFHCGFHDEASFGAASYLIVRPGGNVLIDIPRFNRGLVKRIEALGGVAHIFLTHRDDVASHDRWAAHFGAIRYLHAGDRTARTRGVERWISGTDPVAIADDLLVIPTPGHTRGSACLLHGETLFSGDHLAYSLREERVVAFSGACWFDWRTQIDSMERLAQHRFGSLLPGHGAPCHLGSAEMQRQLAACIAWMRRVKR